MRDRPNDAEALLLSGLISLQTGNPAAAVTAIRASLANNAEQPVAYALLGDALMDVRESLAALAAYDTALQLNPALRPVHYGRANALLELERPVDAVASFDSFLTAEPQHSRNYLAALHRRGAALWSLRRNADALADFQAVIALDPANATAQRHVARALRSLGRPAAALQSIEQAMRLEPDVAAAYVERGTILRDLRRPEEALASFETARDRDPTLTAALVGRGDALVDLRRLDEALAAHDAALALSPRSADAFNGRANSLRSLRRFSESLACYDQALQLDPENAVIHFNRGALLLEWGHREAALQSFDEALRIAPDSPRILRLRADVLLELNRPDLAAESLTRLLELDACFDYAAGALLHARRHAADWRDSDPAAENAVVRAVLEAERADSPFSFLAVTGLPEAQRQCARTFAADRCEGIIPLTPRGACRHARIRVAYVSPDFRAHAVSYLMAGVFERHDRRRFEPIAISLRPPEGSLTGRRVAAAFEQFIDVSAHEDRAAAELMRSLEIDIAVDLAGYTAGCRPQVLAYRPAPIQVNYLGFPATMGAPFIDYLIADEFVVPPGAQSWLDECVVYLPGCFQANDDRRANSYGTVARADEGLSDGTFVFCCFNNTYKINEQSFRAWMRILDRVSGSVLWLFAGTDIARDNLRRAATRFGIDPRRLVFAKRRPYLEYLARLPLADLFLDTAPFNGGTTVSDALWVGLPVLTCAGESFASRMAGSLLTTAGLADLVTFNWPDYEKVAVDLARDSPALQAKRRSLLTEGRQSRLFDTERHCRLLESAYEQMWQLYACGEPPASFGVGERSIV